MGILRRLNTPIGAVLVVVIIVVTAMVFPRSDVGAGKTVKQVHAAEKGITPAVAIYVTNENKEMGLSGRWILPMETGREQTFSGVSEMRSPWTDRQEFFIPTEKMTPIILALTGSLGASGTIKADFEEDGDSSSPAIKATISRKVTLDSSRRCDIGITATVRTGLNGKRTYELRFN